MHRFLTDVKLSLMSMTKAWGIKQNWPSIQSLSPPLHDQISCSSTWFWEPLLTKLPWNPSQRIKGDLCTAGRMYSTVGRFSSLEILVWSQATNCHFSFLLLLLLVSSFSNLLINPSSRMSHPWQKCSHIRGATQNLCGAKFKNPSASRKEPAI